jgi:flagellar biosynthesis protein FlhA
LLNGATGKVSDVVQAFGNFVVGGNYVVGFVIFMILVIINFMVITKGAGRVAEVAARFTLDAMPGKQMSIDADLNAGVIDREEAKKRRSKIENEADFYGAMDGASKFVRGDAIAGIIITSVNIIMGLGIGVIQHSMNFADAAKVYTLLTVGDGLVTQIPSIIVSVAAGIVVTRAGTKSGLSSQISDQIFLHPKALYICAVMIGCMALIPGLPMISFLALSLVIVLMARFSQAELKKRELSLSKETSIAAQNKKGDSIETLLHLDILSLEVGVGLIPLVYTQQNGEILERIVSARKQFAQDIGIIVPMVMVRDNIQLKPSEYQILLKGNVIAQGNLVLDSELAMAPDEISDPIDGIKTKEPAYGLDAFWIKPAQKEEAAFRGYTVVNCATVIVTHLTKVISESSHDLLGRQETQNLVEGLKETAPKVIDEVLTTEGMSLGKIVQILKNLLKENVSIRDLRSIFEVIADHCKQTQNPVVLTRYVRKTLGRSIVKKYLSRDETLIVTTLDRGVEDLFVSGLQQKEDGTSSLNLDPTIAQNILNKIADSLGSFNKYGTMPILLSGSTIRWDLKKLIDRFIPGLTILAFDEIPSDIKTQNIGIISL